MNSGNGGRRDQGNEREHDGQREETAGCSQSQQLRIGSRGIAQYFIEFPPTYPMAQERGGGWEQRNRECVGVRNAPLGEARASVI